jgi:hypothetical protein
MKVKENQFGQYLAEIWQSTNAKMSFARPTKDGWETCHPMVKCKAFMHDAAACMHIPRVTNIYGFTYDPKKMPHILTDRIVIYITGLSEENAQTSLVLMNAMDKAIGATPTTFSKTEKGLLFIGDAAWMKSPAAISLFTGILRMGHYGPVGRSVEEIRAWLGDMKKLKGNDPSYITQAGGSAAWDVWQKLMSDESISWEHGGYEKLNDGQIHHGCGWVAYAIGVFRQNVGDGAFPVRS